MKIIARAIAALALSLLGLQSGAQPAGVNSTPITPTGAITVNNCVKWTSAVTIGDAGAACAGGGGAFNTLAGGTNTTAAMLLGTGASLGTTGTGAINLNCTNGTSVLTGLQSNCTFFDVMAYGVVANDVADDTAAFQAAVNAANAGSGFANIIMPCGKTILIKGSLVISQNYVQLLGCGSGSTIIDFEPAITMTSVVITGTAGQFSCTCTNLAVGDTITISGTYGGTGSITGYSNPTSYYVSATNGTSTFTLQSTAHAAIVTTAGTPTGLTYALAAKSLFTFAKSGGTVEIFLNSIHGVAIASTNTTVTKTAVLLIDSSQFKFTDIQIGVTSNEFTGGSAAPNACGTLDTQAGSIGIRACGRELFAGVQNQILADRPIVYSVDPNISSETIDMFHWQDLYLVNVSGVANPLIWVDSNVVLTNYTMDGYQSWAGGTYGFYWNDATEANASYGIRFDNVRWEQGTTPQYMFYMAPHVQGQTVSFHNLNEQAGGSMMFLRNLHQVDVDTFSYGPDTATVFNIDSSDIGVSWKNGLINASATATISGQNFAYAEYRYPNTTVPTEAILSNNLQVSAATIGSPLTINLASAQPFGTYASSWTTNGLGIAMPAWTAHDNTSSGTIAEEAMSALGTPTLTAASSTTVTDLETLRLGVPVASTNITATNLLSLKTAGAIRTPAGSAGSLALQFGQANDGIYDGGGFWYAYAGGSNAFLVNGSTLQANGLLLANSSFTSTGTTNINASNNAVTNIGTGTTTSAVGIGNGANLVSLGPTQISTGTPFTAATMTGCGTTNGTPGTITGGPQGGQFVGNSSGAGCTVVITINGATGKTATHAWTCYGSDVTSGVALAQSGSSATTCTLKGTLNATTDTIAFGAMGN
jgi:hypothetical protein